ncbi:DNA repair protein RecN [Streptococcus orisratti]
MLLEISIKNFAIIEEISLTFDNGMTVLTGETGAGKSIIIDAMNMMLGARSSVEVIRHGTPKAEIEGFFSVEKNAALAHILEENGIEFTDELIIRREILQNGRSVSRINGQMVNLSTLRAVGQYLVDIHGQHDQEELMRPNLHIAMLDEFGQDDFWTSKKRYQEIFDNYRKLRKRVLDKQKNEREHKARIEMLEFQIAEIEAAALKNDEDNQLNKQRDKLLNHKNIADTLTNAYVMLDNEDFSSLSNIRSAMNDLLTLEEFDPDYKEMSTSLSEAYYVLEEVTKHLGDVIEDLDFDAGLLQQIESRLDVINSITRKYGGSVDDVLDYFDNITKEYNLLTGNNESSDDMEKELKRLEKELVVAAAELSQKRHELANALEAEIKQELAELYMEKADFQVQFTKGKFNRDGNELVEFYISTNPGEGFKPLVKVASGGELSRLMLAIKSAFSRKEDKTSIVFDEVDTGVSGRVAQAIAQKIYKIGKHGQVLAISHLPQVIAIADYQFFIEKRSNENSTVSTVRLLNTEERVEEIAKMLAGADVTVTARQQARELLLGLKNTD